MAAEIDKLACFSEENRKRLAELGMMGIRVVLPHTNWFYLLFMPEAFTFCSSMYCASSLRYIFNSFLRSLFAIFYVLSIMRL